MGSRLSRYWTYLREGQSVYLFLLISILLFVVLQYPLLTQQFPFLEVVFSQLHILVLALFAIYIPLAIIIGYINHHRGSARVDLSVSSEVSSQKPKKPAFSVEATSPKAFMEETAQKTNAFRSHVQETKEISTRLEELTKLLKAGEVSQGVYEVVRSELGNRLSASMSKLFELRESLEVARARAQLEGAMVRPESKGSGVERLPKGGISYSPMTKWERLTDDIDRNLSSLGMEEELFITEQYTLLLREGLPLQVDPEKIEEDTTACKQRLDSILKKWTQTRRNKVEQVVNLELKASRIEEEMKEIKARFTVGELEGFVYESRLSTLRGALKRMEKEISEIRNYIDDIDTRVFKCQELLRESS